MYAQPEQGDLIFLNICAQYQFCMIFWGLAHETRKDSHAKHTICYRALDLLVIARRPLLLARGLQTHPLPKLGGGEYYTLVRSSIAILKKHYRFRLNFSHKI